MHMADKHSMSSIIVLMALLVVTIIVFPWKITATILIIPCVRIASRTIFNEAEADTKDDIEARRELNLSEEVSFLEHLEIAS